MSNPNTGSGRWAPRMLRSRRGWGRTARLGLAVLACAFAGAGQAQVDDYPNLDRAVDGLASKLVAKGSLQGKTVLVRPDDFFEMGSERSLPLSEHLALQFSTYLRSYGAEPVSGSADESKAITLQGRWRIESGSGKLLLSVEAKQLAGAGLNERRNLAGELARVPVANIDGAHLEPDLKFHGRHVVRQLEKYVSGNGRFRLHILPFSADGIPEPERFNLYLFSEWRSAFADSSRFRLVGPARYDGKLHGDIFVLGERIKVSPYILDGQEEQVAAATVEMDRGLFPPDLFGPDVTAELAKCAGLVDAGNPGAAKACYEGVRAGAPGDSVAVEGVRAGLERIAKMEEAAVRGVVDAIGRGELGVAREGLKRLRELNAGHPRLVELEGEIARVEREPGKRFRDCPECPELVVVPDGSFMMGSPSSEESRDDDEGPVHRVTFERPFAVGVKEVTRGEYGRFVSETGRSMGDSCWTYEGGEWEERSGHHWKSPGFSQTDEHPVVCVNWNDAQAYVRWLSRKTGEAYRLLSESEWEYVARAGTVTARYWGGGRGRGQCEYANGADREAKRHNSGWTTVDCDDGYYRTSPVGSFAPNEYKLHDVLGNVWEWVEDCSNDSYSGAPTDGSAWESGNCDERVVRGGSWYVEPWNLRSADRFGVTSGFRSDFVGFRVARTLTP